MSQYLFEVYKVRNQERVFLGYKRVAATSKEEAEIILKEKEESDVQLCQVYFNFDNQ